MNLVWVIFFRTVHFEANIFTHPYSTLAETPGINYLGLDSTINSFTNAPLKSETALYLDRKSF